MYQVFKPTNEVLVAEILNAFKQKLDNLNMQLPLNKYSLQDISDKVFSIRTDLERMLLIQVGDNRALIKRISTQMDEICFEFNEALKAHPCEVGMFSR